MKRVTGVLFAALIISSCDAGGADICDTDRYGCSQNTEAFTPVTEGCPNDPIVVRIGHGLTEFNPLETDYFPPVEFGPQGGSHAYLALEADGIAIDVTRRLKTFLRVWNEVERGCMKVNQDDEAAGCRTVESSRNVLLGDSVELNVVGATARGEDGDTLARISEFGLIVFTAPLDRGSVEVTIEDECGRVAKDIHWFGGAGPASAASNTQE
ncbi:MAG: hypothetical protein VX223_15165 [Myxococcota bacterium]|nr:hypothetical protein [Myxococcota bacterium]